MIDYRKLSEALTEGFIHREYQSSNPQLSAGYFEKAIAAYRTDTMFHARVDSVVAGVMDLVSKHDKEDG